MKYEIADRLKVMVGRNGFLRDLQICRDDRIWTNYNPENLSENFMEIAYNKRYDKNDCNYRVFEWITKAITMAEQLTGLRGGNISGKQLYETVRKFVPDYVNETPTYLDAAASLKNEVRKAVQRSIEAKKQFLVSENPKAYSDMAALIGSADFDEALYAKAIWAHGEGLEEIKRTHIQNSAVIQGLFSEYDDLCHPESKTALKDALIQYSDSLRTLKEDVIFDEIIKTLAKIGKAEKPYLPERALKKVEKHLELARKYERNAHLALADSDASRIRDMEEYNVQIDALIGIEWQIENSGASEELREEYQKTLENVEQLREKFDPVKKASMRKEKLEKANEIAEKEISRLKKAREYQITVLDIFDAQIEAHDLTNSIRGRYQRTLKTAEELREKYVRLEENLHSEPENPEDGLKGLQELIAEQSRDFETIEEYFSNVFSIAEVESSWANTPPLGF